MLNSKQQIHVHHLIMIYILSNGSTVSLNGAPALPILLHSGILSIYVVFKNDLQHCERDMLNQYWFNAGTAL